MPQLSRDDFHARTKRILAERVAYRCSRPQCRRQTIGPHSEPEKSAQIGVAAHIHAAAPGGARYEPAQSTQERSSIANGVWLCQTCSRLIDADGARFPADVLRQWKRECEDETLAQLDGGLSLALTPATQRAVATELLDQAFDVFAGEVDSIRIVWPALDAAKIEKAKRAIAYAFALDPKNQKLPLLQALYHIYVGFPDRALELVESHALENPGLKALKARCLFELGRLDEAEQHLRSEVASKEATAASHYNLGALIAPSAADEALQHFHKALALDPRYAQAHRAVARIHFTKGNDVEARAHLELAYRCQPDDGSIASMMARQLLDTGHTRDARLALERALESNPVDADLWALLAEARGRGREYEEAARCIRRSLAIDPLNVTALNNQMMLLLETGDGPGLKAFFESFPADESSLPEPFRSAVKEVQRTLEEHGGPAGAPQFVTEERLFDWLQASTLTGGPSLTIERFAVCDVASPGAAEEFRGTGVLFVAATTNFVDELPLAEVRLRTSDQSITLRALKERIRLVPEEREEIAARLGRHLYEGVFACPLRKGVVEIDFAKRRTHMQLHASSREEEPEGDPPTDEALLTMAAREFPVMFPS